MFDPRDRIIVATLVILLAGLSGAVLLPAPGQVAATPSEPAPSTPGPVTYREGVVGRSVSITPLTARTRVDRELVGLIFSGLVRLGPHDDLEGDLAESWSVDDAGRVWTFRLRADAHWHDGEPVTSDDVVFTADALKDPDAASPEAASWADVTATAVDARTVTFTLGTPVAGFLEAATQPILPAHLLIDVPLTELAADPFGREPIGSGPYRLVSLQADRALLEPAIEETPVDTGTPTPSADSLATLHPTRDPALPVPYLDRIELRFFDDPADLADAFRAGRLDAVSGLPPSMARPLATETGSVMLRYPTTTLAAILLDLRPASRELRDARVRRALLGSLDRDALITGPMGGAGLRADSLVPPTSWAFDAASAKRLAFDPDAAASSLTDAGWTKVDGSWRAARATEPFAIEILAPTADANPTVALLAEGVAAGWTTLGLEARVTELDAAELAGRLREGRFTAAVVDISFNLDPDLYPLLASTQATSRGGNLSGLQDAKLDKLLAAARKPASIVARKTAFRALIAYLADAQPILPLAWRDETVVIRGVVGPLPRLIVRPGDRYHDVLTWRLAADR